MLEILGEMGWEWGGRGEEPSEVFRETELACIFPPISATCPGLAAGASQA